MKDLQTFNDSDQDGVGQSFSGSCIVGFNLCRNSINTQSMILIIRCGGLASLRTVAIWAGFIVCKKKIHRFVLILCHYMLLMVIYNPIMFFLNSVLLWSTQIIKKSIYVIQHKLKTLIIKMNDGISWTLEFYLIKNQWKTILYGPVRKKMIVRSNAKLKRLQMDEHI